VSAEDVLTFAMFPDLGREYLEQRRAGTLQPEPLLPIDAGGRPSSTTATEFKVDVHGETYEVAITGVGDSGGGRRKLYVSLDGMPEEVIFEPLNEYVAKDGGKRKQASEPGHVTAAMPGNVVEVLVNEEDQVEAGQAVLVTEAMKMESEINANIAGTVTLVNVAKGDRVTPGDVLMEIK
jgi:pyruvate carboxylase subunit B